MQYCLVTDQNISSTSVEESREGKPMVTAPLASRLTGKVERVGRDSPAGRRHAPTARQGSTRSPAPPADSPGNSRRLVGGAAARRPRQKVQEWEGQRRQTLPSASSSRSPRWRGPPACGQAAAVASSDLPYLVRRM